MANLNPPPGLKPVSHYLKVAAEHDARDVVISYWARFAAVQKCLSLDRSSIEARTFVVSLLEWLEKQKKALSGNEAITVDAAGEAHIENHALKLFQWADQQDRSAVFNKNVVKAFYTCGILFDVLESLRPPLSDEFVKARKYAKWKAAYIHNCLKNGETPIPGDEILNQSDDEDPDPKPAHQQFGFVAPNQFQDGTFQNPGNLFDPMSQFQNPGNNFDPMSQFQNIPDPAASFQGMQLIDNQPEVPSVPSTQLGVEQIAKAQKYCKWAGAALNFDDVSSAIDNLEKALKLLKTGQDS